MPILRSYLKVYSVVKDCNLLLYNCGRLQIKRFIFVSKMDQVENVRFIDCKESKYLKPRRMVYKQVTVSAKNSPHQKCTYTTSVPTSSFVPTYPDSLDISVEVNGQDKCWDLMKVHDSVAAVMFNVTSKKLLYVRQFRPAVYANFIAKEDIAAGPIDSKKYPGRLGLTLELCAGICDKDKSLPEIMQDELLEETGFKVPLENIYRVTAYRSGVGTQGSLQTLFYVEVSDSMRVGKGGGSEEEGEMIDLVEYDVVKEAQNLLTDESVNRSPSLLFGTCWFLQGGPEKLKKNPKP